MDNDIYVNMLRGYQKQALDEIISSLSNGEAPLLHLDTGSGKTVIFCEILKRIQSKNKHALMVVRGRQLVQQAYDRLQREKVSAGVLMANHYAYRLSEKIQVVSIDTVISRKLKPQSDLIILDEAHLANSKGYKDFLSQYNVPVLSVTATPYNPCGHLANKIIRPITFNELVEQGYLVPPRYFAPSLPSMKGVKTVNGDYASADLYKTMNPLIGDLVSHYKTIAPNRQTICFAVNLNHSKHITEIFKSNGIPAVHCDADTSLSDRKKAIDGLKSGEFKILCNVGVFNLGVDIPWADCIIMARPTKSLNLYIQQLGRGTRPHEGKTDFIVLDHAGNCLRHGFIEEEREANLTHEEKESKVKSPTTCLTCFAVFYGSKCPNCGMSNPVKLRKLNIEDGELVEIKILTPEQELMRKRKAIDIVRKQKKYKLGWRWYEAKRLYGEEIAEQMFPKRQIPDFILTKLNKRNIM